MFVYIAYNLVMLLLFSLFRYHSWWIKYFRFHCCEMNVCSSSELVGLCCSVFRPGGFQSDHVWAGWEWRRAGQAERWCRYVDLRYGRLAQCRHGGRCLHLRRRLRAYVTHGQVTGRRRDRLIGHLLQVFQVGLSSTGADQWCIPIGSGQLSNVEHFKENFSLYLVRYFFSSW